MSAPMTLEQALEEAKRRIHPWYLTQDGPCLNNPWGWWLWPHGTPTISEESRIWRGHDGRRIGTGAPNPDGWRETLTEVR